MNDMQQPQLQFWLAALFILTRLTALIISLF